PRATCRLPDLNPGGRNPSGWNSASPDRSGRGPDRMVRRHRKGSVYSPSRLSFGLVSTRRGFLDQLFQAVTGRLAIAITGGRRRRLGVSLFLIWFILLESLQDGVLGVVRQEPLYPFAGRIEHCPGL